MITVRVLHTPQDLTLQLLYERTLLFRQDELYRLARHQGLVIAKITTRPREAYLLNDAAAIHLQGQGKYMSFHCIGQERLVNLRTVLEQFLDDVVAKDILNKLESTGGNDLIEDGLLLFCSRGLQFLLDEPRPMLISTELDDITENILKESKKCLLSDAN